MTISMTQIRDPRPGDRRRQRLLDTESVYDVVAIEAGVVRVVVVAAPGLRPGLELRLTADAVGRMELVTVRDGRPSLSLDIGFPGPGELAAGSTPRSDAPG